jgi:hypothetical protein
MEPLEVEPLEVLATEIAVLVGGPHDGTILDMGAQGFVAPPEVLEAHSRGCLRTGYRLGWSQGSEHLYLVDE